MVSCVLSTTIISGTSGSGSGITGINITPGVVSVLITSSTIASPVPEPSSICVGSETTGAI